MVFLGSNTINFPGATPLGPPPRLCLELTGMGGLKSPTSLSQLASLAFHQIFFQIDAQCLVACLVENELLKITDKDIEFNFTLAEWKAMRNLTDDKETVIRKLVWWFGIELIIYLSLKGNLRMRRFIDLLPLMENRGLITGQRLKRVYDGGLKTIQSQNF